MATDGRRYLKLDDIKAYTTASEISRLAWALVSKWGWFEKYAVGLQLVKSVDSIGANLAEGFGRYHKKDKERFYYNARGSVFEASHWIKKSLERNIIRKQEAEVLLEYLRALPKEINHLIRFTEEKLSK